VARAQTRRIPFDRRYVKAAIPLQRDAMHFARSSWSNAPSPVSSLFATDWSHDFFLCRLCDAWLSWRGRPYHKMYRGHELCAMLDATGFQDSSVHLYRATWLWGMMNVTGTKPH